MVLKQKPVAKGLHSEVRDEQTFSVINPFDDEVAGGEPTAVVVGT